MSAEEKTVVSQKQQFPTLTVLEGLQKTKVFSIEKPSVVIGRSAEADIVLQDSEASKFHARINNKDGHFIIEDLNSTNGVFVNKLRVSPLITLDSGATIRIGNTILVFQSLSYSEVRDTVVSSNNHNEIEINKQENNEVNKFGFERDDDLIVPKDAEDVATKLPDRFRYIKTVAKGGMGKILLVQEVLSGRYVALKVLAVGSVHESFVQQFIREAVITARLQHPHIIPVYDLGFLQDNQLYYTMRYVDGHPFSNIMNKIPLEERLRIIRSAALAVDFAHSWGLWHRDIKPDNILIGALMDTYVTDWGLVSVQPGRKYELNLPRIVIEQVAYSIPDNLFEETREADNITQQGGRIVGTPAYLSPEATEGNITGIVSDVWAFGIILFQILTGQHPIHPFPKTSQQLLIKIAQSPFPSPRDINPDVPQELNDLCNNMLHKSSNKRMQTLQEFNTKLASYLRNCGANTTSVNQLPSILPVGNIPQNGNSETENELLRAQVERLKKGLETASSEGARYKKKIDILLQIADLGALSGKRKKELWAQLARL